MKWVVFLFLTGCYSGAVVSVEHVPQPSVPQPDKILYTCSYADHWYSPSRKIAYCDTIEKCNDLCAKEGK